MTNTIAIFGLLVVLMAIGMPVGVALGLTVLSFMFIFTDVPLESVALKMFTGIEKFEIMAIPFFILAGNFLTHGGVARRMINFATAMVGHLRGGLGMSAVLACALFAAVSGSSPATVVAIGSILIPAMIKQGYPVRFGAGVVASAGGLGILIPPSIVLVIYAVLAEQNIAKMFAAAFVPGILAALGYMLVINLYVRFSPSSAGQVEPMPWPERWQALVAVWPVLLIFGIVIGGIYTGIFTPTEGAAVGAVATGVMAWRRGGLYGGKLREAFEATASGSAMVFLIIIGAAAYNSFLALSQLPQELAAWVGAQGFGPYQVLWAILIFYLIAGCVMDSLSMILLTIPIFFPMVSGLDFGLPPEEAAIWFGILVLIVVEVGLITPPVGMNLFVIQSMAPEIRIRDTYLGVMPFVASDLIRVVVLVAVPSISLFVVRLNP